MCEVAVSAGVSRCVVCLQADLEQCSQSNKELRALYREREKDRTRPTLSCEKRPGVPISVV